ncbi:MAG: PH domain-containing protein [Muribaculaceae bacterium]|nr:PH domain-containing protein [Muribaculaceae bacterium]
MNEKVVLSIYSRIVTVVITTVAVVATAYLAWRSQWVGTIVVGCTLLGLIIPALFYSPVRVSADDDGITVHRLLRAKFIPYSSMQSVRMSPPTMGAIRACASDGYFGYWGWFSEGDTGKYFAYYGKSSDCFLITLTDGRKYLIGCNNGAQMEAFVASHLVKRA